MGLSEVMHFCCTHVRGIRAIKQALVFTYEISKYEQNSHEIDMDNL